MTVVVELDQALVGRLRSRLGAAVHTAPRVLGGCHEDGCTELHGIGYRLCPPHRVTRRAASLRRYRQTRP